MDRMCTLAKQYDIKIAFGTDVVVNPVACADQNKEFGTRLDWVTLAEVLTQATANSGELLQLSGDRCPYPRVVGQIVKGAHAALLLVEQDALRHRN